MIFTKPLINKMIKINDTFPTNVYSIIGKEGIVIESIDTINGFGKVKINGELWSATSNQNIDKNTKVKVVNVKGVKLEVEQISKILETK